MGRHLFFCALSLVFELSVISLQLVLRIGASVGAAYVSSISASTGKWIFVDKKRCPAMSLQLALPVDVLVEAAAPKISMYLFGFGRLRGSETTSTLSVCQEKK